jgi:hypothetical protein
MRIEPDDVLLSKGAIIERCIRRIHEEYHADPSFSSFHPHGCHDFEH